MASEAFDPKQEFSFEQVEAAFHKTDKKVERQKSIYEN
jgi:hypothetical protein